MWLSLFSFLTVFRKFGRISEKVLRVGEELFEETLPLQNGVRLYHLQGLKPQMWYEVKISYPASVCVSFLYVMSLKIHWQHHLIRFKKIADTCQFFFATKKRNSRCGAESRKKIAQHWKDNFQGWWNHLIYQTGSLMLSLTHKCALIFLCVEVYCYGILAQGSMSVLVNVESEGVVAIPGKHEREYAVFNIGTSNFWSKAFLMLHQILGELLHLVHLLLLSSGSIIGCCFTYFRFWVYLSPAHLLACIKFDWFR